MSECHTHEDGPSAGAKEAPTGEAPKSAPAGAGAKGRPAAPAAKAPAPPGGGSQGQGGDRRS